MALQSGDYDTPDDDLEEEGRVVLIRQVPLGIIFARIVVVSGMGFAAALAIFFLIGAIWMPALACTGVTVVFLFLMFFIERGAEASGK
ncbi:MAG: hypothetical protein WD904_07875 [Dehalococcoidia bacterium]